MNDMLQNNRSPQSAISNNHRLFRSSGSVS